MEKDYLKMQEDDNIDAMREVVYDLVNTDKRFPDLAHKELNDDLIRALFMHYVAAVVHENNFIEVLHGNPTADDVAKALLDFDFLFVGLSQKLGFKTRGEELYGHPASYVDEHGEYFINIFTNLNDAENWSKHFDRPVGFVYKKDEYNGLFTLVKFINTISYISVNEGGNHGGALRTAVLHRVMPNDSGYMFMSIPDDQMTDNGLMIGLDRVECQVAIK